MLLRKLTINDYEDYKILINEFRPTDFTREEFISTLAHIQNSGDIWVGVENELLIATATIFYEKKFIFNLSCVAHIEDVCVHSSKRGKGFGKQIIQYLFKEAAKMNCYKLTLDCSDENVGFYESCGLKKRGNQMCELVKNLSIVDE